MFKQCRGSAVSLKELADSIFPEEKPDDALHAVSVMLAIAPLARSDNGSVLFPARMHMLFRGIKGVYACTNPDCPHAHKEGGLTLGEVFLSDEKIPCPECGSSVYELFNDRRCGSIFFRGFVLGDDLDARRRTYLWHQPGMASDEKVKEIHLFIPDDQFQLPAKQGNRKILPCYLDEKSGFIDFKDDSLDGKTGIRKLYYMDFPAKGHPEIITFSVCPHCRHELAKRQLTSFSTRGNQSFFNLVKAQFQAQPAVADKAGKGFTICCDCGAAMPGDDAAVLKDVLRPYRSKFNRTPCRHSDTLNVNLGYDFITDMLVLEFALDRRQIDVDMQGYSWLARAGQSLAEALRLAVCHELDIEFTELVTGYRVRQNKNGDFIDVYLYDSLSSGAGYAVSIEPFINKLLKKTRELLKNCSCESACHNCLKHYGNQHLHGMLDRKAALNLLDWGENGKRAPALQDEQQKELLLPLKQILQLSGVQIDMDGEGIWIKKQKMKKKVLVYPAMWSKPIGENTICVSDMQLKFAKPYALKNIMDCI